MYRVFQLCQLYYYHTIDYAMNKDFTEFHDNC